MNQNYIMGTYEFLVLILVKSTFGKGGAKSINLWERLSQTVLLSGSKK
jgi:hypothetical protein